MEKVGDLIQLEKNGRYVEIVEVKKCRTCDGIIKSVSGDNIIDIKCPSKGKKIIEENDLMTCIIYEEIKLSPRHNAGARW